ncbi:hypothetical protein BDZ89DRAFT_183680 [Hymenopellis radicata]|nr:hypothetical protein BDZ89DRAFT_183680 [Hymenopellis radicata]
MLFEFLHSLLDPFIPSAEKYGTRSENAYPTIRDVMHPNRVAKMQTHLWVDCITQVLGTSDRELARRRDILATRICRVEQIRQDVHEANVVSVEFEGHMRYYRAERLAPQYPDTRTSERM